MSTSPPDYAGIGGKFRWLRNRLVCSINWLEDKLLLSPKILYFVISATFYSLYMFRAKFIKDYLRLGDAQYGDISAAMALVSFAFMTIWGSMADALGRHRLVLMSLCALMAGSLELCTFVVKIDNINLRFCLATGTLSLYSFFACGLMPLADYLTLRILTERPGFSKDMYGRQRLWGTISYGLTTYVVGVIIKKTSLVSLFYIVPFCSTITILTLLMLAPSDTPRGFRQVFRRTPKDDAKKSIKTKVEGDDKITKKPSSGLASPLSPAQPNPSAPDDNIPLKKSKGWRKSPIWKLLSNPSFTFMLFAVFMTGSARAVMTTFLGKYWDDKGLTPDQIGIGANFGIVMEIGIFFFGPICIQTMGTYWMLVIAQLAMAIRCWIYVVLPITQSTIWLVYLTELLKGVAFGFTQISGVKLASDAAPPGLEATAQALYTSVYSQLPAVLTALAGGRVYGAMGPQVLFFITAIIMSAALVLFTIKYTFDGSIRFPCQGPRRNHNHQDPILVRP